MVLDSSWCMIPLYECEEFVNVAKSVSGTESCQHHLHCTLLLNVSLVEDGINRIQQVAEKLPPLEITVRGVRTTRSIRVSEKAGMDMFASSLILECPILDEFRQNFLALTGGDPNVHDPYHNIRKTGQGHGHCTLFYSPNEPIHVDNSKFNHITLPPIGSILIKNPDGSLHRVHLGSYKPLVDRGISLGFLEKFYKDNEVGDRTTAQVVQDIILPITNKCKASYSIMLKEGEETGKTVVFVSHAWSMKFLHLIDAIKQYLEKNQDDVPSSTFFWIDIFAVNQHNSFGDDEVPQLKSVIIGARQTLLVLQPWYAPVSLKRIWCLYEVLCTVQKDVFLLDCEVPSVELAHFSGQILEDFHSIRKSVANVNSANAQATKEQDLIKIRRLIDETVGLQPLNTIIKDQIRKWLGETGLRILEKQPGVKVDDQAIVIENPSTLGFAHQLALMYGEIGNFQTARQLFEAVLVQYEATMPTSVETITLANDLAFLLSKSGEPKFAERILRKYIAIADGREEITRLFTLLKNNMAMVVGTDRDRYLEAKELYESVLRQRNDLYGTEENGDSMATMNNLAWLISKHGQYDEAEQLFQKVYKFRKDKHGDAHISTVNTLQNIADILMAKERYDEAEKLLRQIVLVKKENMGSSNPSTLKAIQKLETCIEKNNN